MKWPVILFTIFIIFIIVLADMGKLGILEFINRIPFADKVGHFILYGILTFLINLSVFHSLPLQNQLRLTMKIGFVLALLIGLEEVSQQFFVERSFDLVDLAFSYLGVVFFSWLAIKTT